MLHAFVYKNLEKLFRENKSSPLLKTPEKDFHQSHLNPNNFPDMRKTLKTTQPIDKPKFNDYVLSETKELVNSRLSPNLF